MLQANQPVSRHWTASRQAPKDLPQELKRQERRKPYDVEETHLEFKAKILYYLFIKEGCR